MGLGKLFQPERETSTTHYDPMPYLRTGPEIAQDGKPKFDLMRFNEAYFERLRNRVKTARDEGIYVSVMLFQGFSIEGKGNLGGDPWQGHPLNLKNNVNGVDGDRGTQVHTLSNPDVTAFQEAYVRKVIDTVNDLDNVLYEITNEDRGGPAGTDWQIHLIRFIKDYEAKKPKQHPVGMTAQYPEGKDDVLFQSPADWVSPGARYLMGDGRKVILNDTDHSYFWIGLKQDGIAAQRAWVWKNFTRGNQCVFMDPYLDPSHDRGQCPDGRPARPLLGATSQSDGTDADLRDPDESRGHGSACRLGLIRVLPGQPGQGISRLRSFGREYHGRSHGGAGKACSRVV